jgi:mannose-6-phosphate isomerase
MSDNPVTLYPLRFKEVLRNYSFGGRWIVDVFQKTGLPEDHRVAETWEVVDRPGESSEIVNGPLAGQTLHQAIESYGAALLGTDLVARLGTRFPLLIKFLDASNVLGEQIHPNDEQARTLSDKDPGKTEAWYMLFTRPGATVHCGNKPGIDYETMVQAILTDSSKECMVEQPVAPGDGFLLHAGTMHYARGGVLFYEIMENSDITLGLGTHSMRDMTDEQKEAQARKVADMVHLEEDFDCKTVPVALAEGANRRTIIFGCRYFVLERLDLAAPKKMAMDGERFYMLSLVEGRATVAAAGRTETLLPGNSIMLPAAVGDVEIVPQGAAAMLRSYVPNLPQFVAELRAAGVSDAGIAGLGGHTRLNDLAPLL